MFGTRSEGLFSSPLTIRTLNSKETILSKGKYIILSGGEGSGKTTVHRHLQDVFSDALYVREPGNSPLAEGIRALLLDPHIGQMTPRQEYHFFMTARLDVIRHEVQPARQAGRDVFSDRGWPETFAYQWWTGMGRKDLYRFLADIDDEEIPFPDLWLYFDLDPKVGLQRRESTSELNRIDQQSLDYHQRVREGFLYLYERASFRRHMIDASQPLDQVQQGVVDIVRAFLSAGDR